MAKAERIQHKMVAVMVDGVQLHRVQKFGASADTPQEPTLELSNSGVVEYKKGIPDVSVSLETNYVGNIDNMALLCDRMIDKAKLSAAASDAAVAGPRGGWGRWYIKAASSNCLVHSVNAQNFLTCYCDFMVPVTEDMTNVSRVMWIHYAGLTNLSLAFDANGIATENYQFKAANKRWFANTMKGARLTKLYPQLATSNGQNTITFTTVGSCLPSQSQVAYFCVDDKVYANQKIAATMSAPNLGFGFYNVSTCGWALGVAASGKIRIHSSVNLAATAAGLKSPGSNIYVVYIPTGATATYMADWDETTRVDTSPGYYITSTAGALGGLTRGYYNMWLVSSTTGIDTLNSSNQTLRLQSVNIDIALSSDQLLQLGQHKPYGISRQVPIPVTVSVKANDSDLQLFARMAGTSESTVRTVGIEDFKGNNNLVIEAYRDLNKSTKLQTIYVKNMSVTSENSDIAVGANGNAEINFTADNIRFVPAKSNPATIDLTNISGY